MKKMTATLLIHNQFRLNLPERQLSSSLFFFLRLDSGVDGLAQNWWDRCGCVIPWRPILFEFATWLEKFLNLLCQILDKSGEDFRTTNANKFG